MAAGVRFPTCSQKLNFDILNKIGIYRKALSNKSNIRAPGEAEAIPSGGHERQQSPALRQAGKDACRVVNSPLWDTSIESAVYSADSTALDDSFYILLSSVSVHTGTRKGALHRWHNFFFIFCAIVFISYFTCHRCNF